jgi:uncharacterized membrane protein YoaK (UPF0700 family)
MPTPELARRYTAGLLVLTMSTGAVDAVSYLGLDKVFTGNMTGNVLFIGFALVGVAGIPLLNNVIALAGFVSGSIVSGRIVGHGHPKGFPIRSAWTLGISALVAIAIAAWWLIAGHLPYAALLGITFALAFVMGGQVTAVKPIGNSDVTTIVVTNTVANLARESRLGGGSGKHWQQRLLAVVAMTVGAAIGASVLNFFGGPMALGVAVVIFVTGTATLVLTSRSKQDPPFE